MLAGHTVIAAKGGRALTAAVLAPLGRHDGERSVDCDLLVVSGGEAPAASLALQAGARTQLRPAAGHFALADLPPDAHAAGSLSGQGGGRELSGELAGLAAAHALGLGNGASREPVQAERRAGRGAARRRAAPSAGAASSTSTRT